MSTHSIGNWKLRIGLAVAVILLSVGSRGDVRADGEPAEDFLKRLRAAGYFDTSIAYLDRLNQYPGVKPELIAAVNLEKAQTFIEAAISSRSAKDREKFFELAETSLNDFLKAGNHPRIPEARGQLGRLQMVQATQLMTGEPDQTQREQARNSYLAAAKTFDAIVEDLKGKLTEMRGQKIDPRKDPQKAALNERYKREYLQAMINAADVRKLAAKTYDDPAKEGKQLLEESRAQFTNLTEKYRKYVPGIIAMMHLGQVYQTLGDSEKALDNYMRMLEGPDADPLRDSRFQSGSGLIQIRLAESPPKFQDAIDRTKDLVSRIRPNEKNLPSVQQLRLDLAKAYLEKSKDEKQKPTDKKRAESDGRQLLLAASRVPGPHLKEAQQLLSGLGIEQGAVELPKAEPPKNLDDALEKARELLTATQNMQDALKALEGQPEGDDLKKQKEQMQKDIAESNSIAIQILRWGVGMANQSTDFELLNQARSYLAYFLVQDKRYRDATVVGRFLARNSPGTDIGLGGGLMALNSLQNLLVEVPEEENDGLIAQLETLGDYLTKTWPNDPRASAAQGLRVRLMLSKENWDEARALIEKMPDGPEPSSLRRLLGQLLWNASLGLRRDGDDAGADKLIEDAAKDLRGGLDGISGGLVDQDAMKASLVLAKILYRQEKNAEALAILDNETYGPIQLLSKLGAASQTFEGDLYTTELKVLIREMIASGEGDISALQDRAAKTMEKLRDAFPGADGQAKLTAIYRRLANDVREELDQASPAKKTKLIEVFQVLLERIASATKDPATLQWVGQTLMNLGEAAMAPGEIKAEGQAFDLLEAASNTFKNLLGNDLTISYLYARANRLMGEYKTALDELEKILKQKAMMLDAQREAAQAYESWAGVLDNPKFKSRAYRAALGGGRPNAKGQNTIWGWGKISQLTNGKDQFKEEFFDARYHIALTRFLMGKALKDTKVIDQAAKDVTSVEALFPQMGGKEQHAKFDALLKSIQKEQGEQPKGLKPFQAQAEQPKPNG